MTPSTSVPVLDWQPEDPLTLADPFPILARLREEDPCYWSPRLKSWVLTRYDDVKRVCLDKAQVSSDRLRPFFESLPTTEADRIGNIIRYLSLWMVFKDPPDHTRLRKLAGKVFHARSMRDMRPKAEEISRWLIRQLDGRDQLDLIRDYAGPMPCLVIMAMLGVPRDSLPELKRMSDDMALFIGSARVSEDKYDTAEQATREMAEFFRALIDERRAQPQDDLLSELVNNSDDGDRLTNDELVATCILLLFAGHETTTNHIANAMLALMRHPEQMHKLRKQPLLAPSAVEELLRFDGPSPAQVRIVLQRQQLHGKELEVGQRVFIMLNAANRDPRAYPDPDRLDIERDGVPHLAFGFGSHLCLGFPLARLEGQIALSDLLRTYAQIEQTVAEPTWINSIVFRGMKTLPVNVRPA